MIKKICTRCYSEIEPVDGPPALCQDCGFNVFTIGEVEAVTVKEDITGEENDQGVNIFAEETEIQCVCGEDEMELEAFGDGEGFSSTHMKCKCGKKIKVIEYDLVPREAVEVEEARFMLEEDSICYGCVHYKHIENIDQEIAPEDISEFGGACDAPEDCINGHLNGYINNQGYLEG